MVQAGLVLEGGGMKGIYTAGVLDFFMEKDLLRMNCADAHFVFHRLHFTR